jgi:hypothetical protein
MCFFFDPDADSDSDTETTITASCDHPGAAAHFFADLANYMILATVI